MRVLITGANGFIGSHLVQALSAAGHEILACTRNPEDFQRRWPAIIAIEADYVADHAVRDWIKRVRDVDVVINAVGIIRENRRQTFDALHTQAPLALFQACQMVGVKRVIQISALGADDKAFSHYHLSKRSADHFLRRSRLDWTVVMPSIVYGPGAKSMALFTALAALPVIPLIDNGEQRIQPIHITDLTKAIVQLVDAPAPICADIEMVGPEAISMKSLYTSLRCWLGLGQGRFLSVPYGMALRGAGLIGLLGRTPITEEAVQMLRKGNTGEVEPYVKRFGFVPQSMQQALSATPSHQADRWYAGLYFLAPLLRLSIASLWLFTGLVSTLVFPLQESYNMLARVGIEGAWQPLMLYGAAAVDILLGVATLISYRLNLVGRIQIGVILLYSGIITLWLPEYWAHPFGSVSKNLPLIVATLIMISLEGRK
jgi:uncharacterized protein YbjT (DUF2867 family)